VRLPGTIVDLNARRFGDEVVLQFTVPQTNTDGSRPADLDRIEVYAHTGPLPAAADFLKYGALIGNVAVRSPVPGAGGSPAPGVEPGTRTSVSEKITTAELDIGRMPVVRPSNQRLTVPVVEPVYETPDTVNAPIPTMRYYVAVGVSHRNRRGTFSTPLPVPLLAPMSAPVAPEVKYAQDAVLLSWTPLPRDEDIFVPRAVYNVYEVADTTAPDVAGSSGLPADSSAVAPAGAKAEAQSAKVDVAGSSGVPAGTVSGSSGLPVTPTNPLLTPPLNAAPLAVPEFQEPQVTFGVRRCYMVRAVRMAGLISIESEPSPSTCLTPIDTFPPEAPRQLAAVASEGAVSLIWEPNTDKDLAGYLVLRGETGAEKLTAVTPEPIHDTTFRDTTVKSGMSYDYVVVAIDAALPPNTSEYSNRQTVVIP